MLTVPLLPSAPSVPNCIKHFPPWWPRAAQQEVTLRAGCPETCSLKSPVRRPLRCDLPFSQAFWLGPDCRRMPLLCFYKRQTLWAWSGQQQACAPRSWPVWLQDWGGAASALRAFAMKWGQAGSGPADMWGLAGNNTHWGIVCLWGFNRLLGKLFSEFFKGKHILEFGLNDTTRTGSLQRSTLTLG